MNYPQFFAILGNQCQRFAPDVQVPADFERVLDELRSTTNLAAFDEPLRLAFTALLTPRFISLLSEAHGAVTDMVQERIQAIDQERTSAMVLFEKQQTAALEQERTRQQEHEAAMQELQAQRSRILELEQQMIALQQKS